MNGREIYKIWAPSGAKWVDWVRPVPFIAINDNMDKHKFCEFEINNIEYIEKEHVDTAIIVDLPDYDSVEEGISLAKLGYRPIPLYNGTDEQEKAMPIVDNHSIESALVWGASELGKIKLKDNATPAFLLDTNRMHRFKMDASVFDNSWDIYDQDMPSAEYFLKNGINKIIIRGSSIQKDLRKILYEFQKKGIEILFADGSEKLNNIKIKKPPRKDN